MEDDQWYDPLLTTDVSRQLQEHNTLYHYQSVTSPSSPTSTMADPDGVHPFKNDDHSVTSPSSPTLTMADPDDVNPLKNDGRSMLGFSLTSPDLVICAESPDIPRRSYVESPEFSNRASIELSLENGINGSEMENAHETPATTKFSTSWPTAVEDASPVASFELLPPPIVEEKLLKDPLPIISINAGSLDGISALDGIDFLEDSCFSGGDTTRTDTTIGDGNGHSIYQTARFGNFSYHFKALKSGNYSVDLHLAEIMFTDGPPGMRVFDVFIQEQKAVSDIDIYARVGANKPLVISDLKAFVSGDEGLTIRFEGVTGSPIVCGISIRGHSSASFGEVELLKVMGMSQMPEYQSPKDIGDYNVDGDSQKLRIEYECQKKELTQTRRALEELKKENERKSRECQEAWKFLKDLQNELMRKSMHVGSLAFAIEGQVKEKSRWFLSLRDLTRKLKILKMEHVKLSEEALSYKKCMLDMNDMSSTIQSKINQQVELHEDLKIKYIKGAKERKELYNKILELKGNIRVFCRCRPLNNEEVDAGASMAIDFEGAKDGELTVKSNGALKKTFKFDSVFAPQANQVDVFEDTAPFATSVLDGYNVCIFAYGQTGTGKTFTMEGTDEARGVNFRTLEELFRIVKERKGQIRYEISVSVLEVYNEQIRDLLVPGQQPGVTAKRLEIRQVGEGIHHVPGLVEAQVNNTSEVWEVLKTGSNARAVGSTNANEHSSRSHCIHCVMVKGENLLNGECTRSKLWLIDLAGSERVAKTEVQGERLKETQNINRSLSALGDVISALATKSPHIPFRNSKLTHLLQDSLGGDSKTLMFVQISPNETDLSETLCSLNFASRVRGIELGPAKKQLDNTDLLKYKQMVEKTKLDMRSKDVQIKKLEDTVHGLDVKMKEKELKNKNMQDKIKELESQLLIERKLARQHVDSKLAEQQQQQQQQQMRQRQEEQNSALMRQPLTTRPIGVHKNYNEGKDQVTLTRPLTENNSYKLSLPPTVDGFVKHNDPTEKENNPDMAEYLPLPKRTGRASICTTAQRIPAATAPRRNSLIPLPTVPGSAKFPPPLFPLPPIQADEKETDGDEAKSLTEPASWDSPKEHKSGGKKVSSILRRSLQKKIQMKSPMQQHIRRGGVNVGMEKVRVSIGSRGRMGQRVLLGSARRVTKDVQQKRNHMEKERGWNSRTVF
ncbi:kinesin-like protein KIN-14Q [Cornus florida]|uniref:kinesin-like protein KIN-14Q n=1 Tax=Cornus florida TaxID=4283 RepID=UPI0028A10BCC|nr:kinesin-like protein KIN-14Q [Cornus florida]